MRKLVLAGLATAALAVGTYTPAEASGGCGPFGHRGFYGACRPNHFGYGYGYRRPFFPGYGFHGGYGYHHGYGYHRFYR
jgi:hypothetical protein